MNEVIKALLERRSIRQYRPDPVEEKDLEAILNAGLYAPSSRSTQAVHLTAIVNPDLIAGLDTALKKASVKPGFDKYAAMVGSSAYTINFRNAPVFIVASVDPTRTACPGEDAALVLGNIFLAAHSLGYGTCWVNQLGPAADEPEFRRFLTQLGVPEGYRVIGSTALGRPAGGHPRAPSRRAGRVHIVR